jgi:heparin/heparan-sulfate lyase
MSPLFVLSLLPWAVYDGVRIPVPPPEHPRLYLTGRDVPDLQRRMAHPVLKPVWEKMQEDARREPARAVEVDALRYLVGKDATLARSAVAATLKLLHETRFDMNQQDVTRPIGRLLVTGAMVYDWCYPVLTPAQKRDFLERMQHLAKMLECGYPPPKAGGITGHYSEWMLMRDMLSAGVALYDEFPEMYQVAANRFFSLFVPPRNWWYAGGAFHQGTSYAETRGSAELYPLWIFDRMGAGAVYDSSLQYLPYEWIYKRRPDGQLLRGGDGQGRIPKLRSLLNASYYKNPYVLADYLATPDIDRPHLIFELLWRDPDLKPRPVSELPLSHYMGAPYGWMVARSGWDADSVIAEMKVNEYNFNNHQHLDAGAFQLWYKGSLAIDSGLYQGDDGGYGSPHDVNYNKRTIGHNSLLILDPAEKFQRSTRELRNDGGQKLPAAWREPRSLAGMKAEYRTGAVLGRGFGPDPKRPLYTYLKGDITQAYSAKVKEVQRSFVYLNTEGPVRAVLAVFDRVVSADPSFKKYWLLHSMEQPRVDGAAVTIAPRERGWTGKLVNETLLPIRAEITPVGGPGKEFWVFGQNFPNRPKRGDPNAYEIGQWRVEVSPREAAATDVFLNVMQAMDRDTPPLPVRRIDAGAAAGFYVAGATVLFQREGKRTGAAVVFRSEGKRFLVVDLNPGEWRILRDGRPTGTTVRVTPNEGAIWFDGQPGDYRLEPVTR